MGIMGSVCHCFCTLPKVFSNCEITGAVFRGSVHPGNCIEPEACLSICGLPRSGNSVQRRAHRMSEGLR